MPVSVESIAPSKARLWTGRILSIFTILFLLFDAVMKFVRPLPVTQAMTQLGFPQSLSLPIGVILLVCTIAYAVPSTSVLGSVLLTGYLGGAVVVQMRIGSPVFSMLFPVGFAVLMWVGIYLREPRLHTLIPVRTFMS